MKNYFGYICITLFMLPLSILSMENPAENNHLGHNVSSNKRTRTVYEEPYESEHSNDEIAQLSLLHSLLDNNPPTPSECLFKNKLTFYSLQPEHQEQETPQEFCDPTHTQTDANDAFIAGLFVTTDSISEEFQEILPQSSTNPPTTSSKKSHICPTCGKSFARSTNLKDHERLHTGEKLFKCTTCDKAFTNSSHLKIHERIHTGEKPYTCTICNKSFTRSSVLKNHERTHTDEKPFKCTTCSKSFAQSSTLKNHERTHSGEKPYKCTACGKSFTRSSDLKIHERTISHRRKILEK